MVVRPVLLVFLLYLITGIAVADVSVGVDRDRVELNESFTLEISVDTNTASDPDLSALDEDFFVGQSRQLQNTTIVNGQIQRSMSWTYSLMAKRAGTLTIPAISVDGEESLPFTIEVTEPTYEPPGEADVFITTEVDTTSTYVQAQVLYRIKVYRAVATRQPTLREPVFSGAEVLIELAGDERNYESILGGKAYAVNERVYALFPQESGTIEISPARFEARVLRDGRITGRKIFSSDAQTIDVRPIPEAPPAYRGAAWLPARELSLSEDWSETPDEITAGEPITRNITISALGQLETQIPAIEPPAVDGVNVYPDKPELSRQTETDGIRGIRRDQYALIGVRAGDVTLPGLELPWFDLDDETWKLATLPARTLGVLPTDELFEPPQQEAVAADVPATERIVVESPFWRRLSQFLGAAWALTLVAWWWSTRPAPTARSADSVPLHRQQSRLLNDARKAAQAGDAAALKRTMLDWAQLQWPDRPPRSVGELATRVSEPLAGQLQSLSRSAYGSSGAAWDREAMAKAIRSFGILPEDSKHAEPDALPPLMPRS